MNYEDEIDEIQPLLFDFEEPGCRDTENGDMIINEIGYVRLKKWLRQHDARLYQELSHNTEFIKASMNQRAVVWLEARASEIEREGK